MQQQAYGAYLNKIVIQNALRTCEGNPVFLIENKCRFVSYKYHTWLSVCQATLSYNLHSTIIIVYIQLCPIYTGWVRRKHIFAEIEPDLTLKYEFRILLNNQKVLKTHRIQILIIENVSTVWSCISVYSLVCILWKKDIGHSWSLPTGQSSSVCRDAWQRTVCPYAAGCTRPGRQRSIRTW